MANVKWIGLDRFDGAITLFSKVEYDSGSFIFNSIGGWNVEEVSFDTFALTVKWPVSGSSHVILKCYSPLEINGATTDVITAFINLENEVIPSENYYYTIEVPYPFINNKMVEVLLKPSDSDSQMAVYESHKHLGFNNSFIKTLVNKNLSTASHVVELTKHNDDSTQVSVPYDHWDFLG